LQCWSSRNESFQNINWIEFVRKLIFEADLIVLKTATFPEKECCTTKWSRWGKINMWSISPFNGYLVKCFIWVQLNSSFSHNHPEIIFGKKNLEISLARWILLLLFSSFKHKAKIKMREITLKINQYINQDYLKMEDWL